MDNFSPMYALIQENVLGMFAVAIAATVLEVESKEVAPVEVLRSIAYGAIFNVEPTNTQNRADLVKKTAAILQKANSTVVLYTGE